MRSASGWEVAAPIGRFVPHSFASTVKARLLTLGPDGRRLLGAAALLGRSFDWKLAAQSAGFDEPLTEELLQEALSAQLLAADGQQFSFRHALTREVIASELLPHERQTLAARCLDALREVSSEGDDFWQRGAELAEIAGQREQAAALLLAAGRTSLRRGTLETATAALARAADLARDQRTRADVFEALAEARSAAGDLPATQKAVHAALDELALLDAPRVRLGNARLPLARCAVTATHFDVALEELGKAQRIAEASGDRGLEARCQAVAAQLAMGEGRRDEAEMLAVHAAEIARETAQGEVVCEALEVAARCARTRDLEEADRIGWQAVQAAEEAYLPVWRVRGLYQLGVVEMFRTGSAKTLERARAEAERIGAVAIATSLDLEIAAALEAQHRLAEARATCGRCIEMSRLLHLRGVEAVAHAFIGVIDAEEGNRGAMEEAFERAMLLDGSNVELTGAMWADGRAIASLVAEDRTRARKELEQALSIFKSGKPSTDSVVPRLGAALLALVVAVDGGEPDFSAAAGVTQLNSQGAGYLAYAEAVLHGRKGDRERAAAAARRGDTALALMPFYRNLVRRIAAEAALCDHWGDPVAWLTEASQFFDQSGHDRIASACRALLRRAGVRMVRNTKATRTMPPPLRHAGVTRREAEVLALVAEGLSNRGIAERLFLSERTVEQHVASLKQKLAAQSRAQLAVHGAAGVAAGN